MESRPEEVNAPPTHVTARLRTRVGDGPDSNHRVFSEAALRQMQRKMQTGSGVPVRDGAARNIGQIVGAKLCLDGTFEIVARVDELPPTLRRLVAHGRAEFVASGVGRGHRETPDGPLVLDEYDLLAMGFAPRRDPARLCTFCHAPLRHLGNDIWGCDNERHTAPGATTSGGSPTV